MRKAPVSGPGFDWPQLMRLGFTKLGLRPDQFWALTPNELMVMLGLDGQGAPSMRARLDELLVQFPDERPADEGE
ncbi:rcc01693 family protein [Aliiroseovarius crassostreae]|uniref:rcc01693 family protein n=1 Tax=Aliiroseovarius crassostreae TaxID=154981 RepID=UPI00223C2155|nr:rcc01693 family protein [Aliiroseovarius crassostreae]